MSPALVRWLLVALVLTLALLLLLRLEYVGEKVSSALLEPGSWGFTVIRCDFCIGLVDASGDSGEDIDSLVDVDADGPAVSVSEDNDDDVVVDGLEVVAALVAFVFGGSEPLDSVRFRCVCGGGVFAGGVMEFDTDLLRTRLGLETNLFILGKIVGKCFCVAMDLRAAWFCAGVRCGFCGGDDSGSDDADDEKEISVE